MVSRLPRATGNHLLPSSTARLHRPPKVNTTNNLLNLPRDTGNHPLLSNTVRHPPSRRMEPRLLLNPTALHLHPANTTRRHSKELTARHRRRLSNHTVRSKDTGNPRPSNPTASSRMASPLLSNISRTGNSIRRHLHPPATAHPKSLLGMEMRTHAL
jgi:hypothetical protein